MTNKKHAATLERVFRAWGLKARVVETGNNLWAVTVTRDDGRILRFNDDAAGLYETEDVFLDGAESQVITLC